MSIATVKGLDYKKSLHEYVLQRDYVTERLAISLESVLNADNATNIDAVVNAFLVRCSNVLYQYIYTFNPHLKKYMQYELCHKQDWAEEIRECLLDMVLYHTLNGLDSTILNPLLNVNPDSRVPVLTLQQLQEAAIPVGVRQRIHGMKWDITWGNVIFDESLFDEYAREELLMKE